MEHIRFTSWTFALFILYLFLSLFIGLQLIRIVYYRHKLRSFQVGFLLQCFCWALLRTLFFLLMDVIGETIWLYLIIYWFPINIQFSTFSLLVVYYAHLHHREKVEWKAFKQRYVTAWIVVNVVFFILASVLIGLGIAYDQPGDSEPEWLSIVHGIFTGGVFFLLVIVLAWHGWKAAHLMKEKATVGQTKLLAKISFPKILIVTFALFVLFTSRCLYDFVSITGALAMNVESGTTIRALFTFAAFCLWEIVPTILVLVLFGNVHATTLGAFSKRKNQALFQKNPNYMKISITDSGPLSNKAQLFNDPRRYDSDDETSSLKSSPHYYGSNSSPGVYPYPVHSISDSGKYKANIQ